MAFRKRRPRRRRGAKFGRKFAKAVTAVVDKKAETKYCYGYAIDSAVTSSANMHECLSLIAEGDTYSNRNGQRIRLKYLEVAVQLKLPSAQTDCVPVRVILYRSSGNEFGALPDDTDIVDNTDGIAAATWRPLGPHVLPGNEKQYHVYYDKTIMLGPNPIDRSKVLHIKRKLPGLITMFDGASAAIGDATTGHLFLLVMGTVDTNNPTCSYMSRIKFVDY